MLTSPRRFEEGIISKHRFPHIDVIIDDAHFINKEFAKYQFRNQMFNLFHKGLSSSGGKKQLHFELAAPLSLIVWFFGSINLKDAAYRGVPASRAQYQVKPFLDIVSRTVQREYLTAQVSSVRMLFPLLGDQFYLMPKKNQQYRRGTSSVSNLEFISLCLRSTQLFFNYDLSSGSLFVTAPTCILSNSDIVASMFDVDELVQKTTADLGDWGYTMQQKKDTRFEVYRLQ